MFQKLFGPRSRIRAIRVSYDEVSMATRLPKFRIHLLCVS
jgi:hypothetical protein